LEDAPFDGQESVGIGYVDSRETVIQRPQMIDRLSTVHHDNQGSFSSNKIDQELEESVNRKSLVESATAIGKCDLGINLIYIADWIYKHCNLCRFDAHE
jgi:hypothetical protein